MSRAFGGNWTEEKLEVMRRYFAAYSQALKNQRFTKWLPRGNLLELGEPLCLAGSTHLGGKGFSL